MNNKAKNIAAVALAVCGVSIWIPQLMGAGGTSQPNHVDEIPAEGQLRGGQAILDGWEPAAPSGGSAGSSEDAANSLPSATPQAVSKSTSNSLEKLLNSGGATRSLADLSSLWGEDAEPSMGGGFGLSSEPRRLGSELGDPLRLFLEENALTGIIVGKHASMASFGPYIFAEGDHVLASGASVSSVAPRFVVFEYRGEDVRVELPPFRSRLAPTPASNRSELESPEAPEVLPVLEEAVAPAGVSTNE